MQRVCKVEIPARKNAPATNLYTVMAYENEESLHSKPYIIMLSGGPGLNHSYYKDYADLKDVANIIFFDPRGCGLSDRSSPETYTAYNNIEDIDLIREFFKLDKVILLGKSYGAMCALGYTLRYPQYVSKLVLAAGSPTSLMLETAKINASKRNLDTEQVKILKKMLNGAFTSDEDATKGLKKLSNLYSYKVRHGQPVSRPPPDYPVAHEVFNQGFQTFIKSFNFTSDIHKIQCKTLVLVGDEDWITDKKYSKQIAKAIKGSELIIFPKADHSMESDVPEQFFAAIRRFVS